MSKEDIELRVLRAVLVNAALSYAGSNSLSIWKTDDLEIDVKTIETSTRLQKDLGLWDEYGEAVPELDQDDPPFSLQEFHNAMMHAYEDYPTDSMLPDDFVSNTLPGIETVGELLEEYGLAAKAWNSVQEADRREDLANGWGDYPIERRELSLNTAKELEAKNAEIIAWHVGNELAPQQIEEQEDIEEQEEKEYLHAVGLARLEAARAKASEPLTEEEKQAKIAAGLARLEAVRAETAKQSPLKSTTPRKPLKSELRRKRSEAAPKQSPLKSTTPRKPLKSELRQKRSNPEAKPAVKLSEREVINKLSDAVSHLLTFESWFGILNPKSEYFQIIRDMESEMERRGIKDSNNVNKDFCKRGIKKLNKVLAKQRSEGIQYKPMRVRYRFGGPTGAAHVGDLGTDDHYVRNRKVAPKLADAFIEIMEEEALQESPSHKPLKSQLRKPSASATRPSAPKWTPYAPPKDKISFGERIGIGVGFLIAGVVAFLLLWFVGAFIQSAGDSDFDPDGGARYGSY